MAFFKDEFKKVVEGLRRVASKRSAELGYDPVLMELEFDHRLLVALRDGKLDKERYLAAVHAHLLAVGGIEHPDRVEETIRDAARDDFSPEGVLKRLELNEEAIRLYKPIGS